MVYQRCAQSRFSALSLILASSFDCHCILWAASSPPAQIGMMWSITQPGHAPYDKPVEGQGCKCLKSALALADLFCPASLFEQNVKDTASRISTDFTFYQMH